MRLAIIQRLIKRSMGRRTPMSHQRRIQKIVPAHAVPLWINLTVMALGLWLVSGPFALRYPPGKMLNSDILSGAWLFFFAAIALIPKMNSVGRWGVGFVGIWLQFAPLAFWAPQPVMMINDTVIGLLAIVLFLLISMITGITRPMELIDSDPGIPLDWSYNPSGWRQRIPVIILAFIGWFISRYLAFYQLGYISSVWDPFFEDGTRLVLTSKVSQMIPVSDAGLGAFAYTLEMLIGCTGGATRWRTMPCVVLIFFILVVPLGLVSITLVVLQPVVVGHWCALCLAIAAAMLLMITIAVDEVFAMVQFMRLSLNQGKPFWRTFLAGEIGENRQNKKPRAPTRGVPVYPMAWMIRGVSVPWTLPASALLGIWLMVLPAVWLTTAAAANSDHVAGALIIATSVIAMSEVVRRGRHFNLLLGAWVILASCLLNGANSMSCWNGVITGLLIIVLSLPRGEIRERYGSWHP